jgi:hypothetical protein
MKHILLTLVILKVSILAFTAPKNILVTNNGNWNTASVWSLNRVPANNDTIIVPAGLTLILSSNISLNNLYISVYGKIKLSNGKLTLDNVSDIYVQIGGTITGGGNNDKIKIGNAEVFRGSEPAVIGPAFADNTTGNSFESFAVLPVKFLSFSAKKVAGVTELKWSTSDEINNSHFEIQYRTDGSSWKTIGEIKAIVIPTAINRYTFTHTNTTGQPGYYRIKQVDNSGHVSYSSVEVVHSTQIETNAEVFVQSKGVIAVRLDNVNTQVTIKVFTQSGRLIVHQIHHSSGKIQINLLSTRTEIYVVQVINDGKLMNAKKLLM